MRKLIVATVGLVLAACSIAPPYQQAPVRQGANEVASNRYIASARGGQGVCMSYGKWNKAECSEVTFGEGICMSIGKWNKSECQGVTVSEGYCMSGGKWNRAECSGVD